MKKQILAAACAVMMTAGIVAQAQVVVRVGPPARVYERVPPPPRLHRDWVWHAGYHRWDGARYVWVPGTYVAPPHPHARWVEGHWDRRPGGWVWVEGRWY